jgi:hypothetical protein
MSLKSAQGAMETGCRERRVVDVAARTVDGIAAWDANIDRCPQIERGRSLWTL